ncbi:MAG: hypothetical protein IT340_17440 [Chloroflexi bacterium]|nr:hypothetical protein [Chloroflexota bacterium]
MIVVRQVFQARYGRGDELVALFKEFGTRMQAEGRMERWRILTDASGPFFTVISEAEMPNLAAWEQVFGETMGQPWIGEWFGRMMPLVESGSREFYTIVE